VKVGLRGAIGILLSAALLVFALRDVSFAEVWRVLRASDPLLFAAATVTGTLTFALRARRWRTILEPVVPDIPFGPLWRATTIGAMVNNVIPVRAGELARAYAITREVPGITFAGGIASLAVDRLFDSIVVLLLMLLAMLHPAFGQGAPAAARDLATSAAILGAAGLGVVLVTLYAIVFFPARLIALFELFARRVAPRVEERGRQMLRTFADGLGVLRHPARFATVLWWTTLHWLLAAFSFWLGFRAVGIDVPLSASLLVQGLIAISVALPAAPGFFGPFELAGKAGLALYGVQGDLAVSWAIGYHLLTFVPVTLFGAAYFARLGLKLGDIGRAAEGPAAGPRP
jgi:uncharacterized protein (TIRG00374 family)